MRVRDAQTLGFSDHAGSRHYITSGNLADNRRADRFLIDDAQRSRIKNWGTARVIDDDPGLTERLMSQGYKARPKPAILFTVTAWDSNCPQHIPQRFDAADVATAVATRDPTMAELEAARAERA